MSALNSMTGFASGQGSHDAFDWTWDIRGVNAKGLDLRVRVPDWIDGLEADVRKAAGAALNRGNVTISLRLSRRDGEGGLQLNTVHLDAVLSAMAEIEQQAMGRGISLAPSTSSDIIALRGILDHAEPDADVDDLKSNLIKDFDSVLHSFSGMRAAEGRALGAVLNDHLEQIATLVAKAERAADARRPKADEALRTALSKVLDTSEDLDESRIAQELALLAVKADITEEIKRLQAHVEAARTLLQAGGVVGRKLDFLMQEFNREANTLCSKSGDSALTAVGLDLKAVIDQLREQVQNVE